MDKLVTGIDVKSSKTELAPGKMTTVSAVVTPADASRQIVKWTSDNEDIATVEAVQQLQQQQQMEAV